MSLIEVLITNMSHENRAKYARFMVNEDETTAYPILIVLCLGLKESNNDRPQVIW